LDIDLVLRREPRTDRTWFFACSILPNEDHVGAAIRQLFEETGLALTVDDVTMLSNKHVRMLLPCGKRELVYVLSAYVLVPYVTTNFRTLAKVD
jgi:ADP-ribose pyrophosphatase YjhB (NUDIX family)